MNLGASSTQSLLSEGEKDIIFEACKDDKGEASVANIENLCEAIEREMLNENKKLNVENQKDKEMDLQNVNLGFDSDSEGTGDNNSDRDSVAESDTQSVDTDGNLLDKSRDRSMTMDSGKGDQMRDSVASKMLSLTSKNGDQKRIRLLEDAKDALLEAVENLSVATEKVDKLK